MTTIHPLKKVTMDATDLPKRICGLRVEVNKQLVDVTVRYQKGSGYWLAAQPIEIEDIGGMNMISFVHGTNAMTHVQSAGRYSQKTLMELADNYFRHENCDSEIPGWYHMLQLPNVVTNEVITQALAKLAEINERAGR